MNLDKYFNDFEEVSNIKLPSESLIAIRVDGKNFKNFTKTLNKPFDDCFGISMQAAMKATAKSIQGCFYAFTQSDEITFLVANNREQPAYFNNRIQKITSVVASQTTINFYKSFLELILSFQQKVENQQNFTEDDIKKIDARLENLWEASKKNPIFDARCFTIPYNSMHNLIYNRQRHNYNNAILSIAKANNICTDGLKLNELVDAITNAGIDINSFGDNYLYGVQAVKVNTEVSAEWQISVLKKLEFEEMD